MKATKEKAAPAADTPAHAKEIFHGYIPLTLITTNGNFRKHFDEKQLQELANNIKEFGVLQPVLVRLDPKWATMEKMPAGTMLSLSQIPTAQYILIAGERRLRAAKMAGLKEILARALDVDEKGAAEIQALENLHRKDLGPIEEAQAFKTLLDQGGYTVESLAERIDKSVPYVYRAIRLLELPEKILAAIGDGTLTPAHGHAILRVPEEKREPVVKAALKPDWHSGAQRLPTAKELVQAIERELGHDLREALFPKDVAYAGEIACKECPFNSGNQGMLFEGAEKGKCLKASCFDKKTAAHFDDFAAKAGGTFKGLEFLGAHETDYQDIVVIDKKCVLAMTPERKRALGLGNDILAEAKKKPAAWGWIVKQPSYDGQKPSAVLVCRDFNVLPKQTRPSGGSSLPGVDRAATIRQNFIEKRIAEALTKAALESAAAKFSKAHLAVVISAMGYLTVATREGLGKFIEVPKDFDNPNKLAELPERDLQILAFGRACWGWAGPEDKVLQLVGVDVKKIKAEARKVAQAELDAKKNGKAKK
jgi:ParB family chromosome partitioning protein